jgi:hypothetical protein
VGHFSVEDGYTVEFWTALEASVVAAACSSTHDASDVVLAIRGLPRCPPPPPPEAPPEAPSAPSEGGSTQLPDNPVGGEGDGTNGWGLP